MYHTYILKLYQIPKHLESKYEFSSPWHCDNNCNPSNDLGNTAENNMSGENDKNTTRCV